MNTGVQKYQMGNFGGMAAPKRAKQALLGDMQRLSESPQDAGLTSSERDQMTEEAARAAGAQSQAISTDLAQTGLGSGWSGQMAETARQAAGGVQNAVAAASSDAYKYSNQVARQFAQDTRARLEAQQERALQNAQFWSQQGINLAEMVPSLIGLG